MDWTLNNQAPSGMIGPPVTEAQKNTSGQQKDFWWPRMPMVKALAQHYEATQDPRVIPVLTRYFHYQLAALPETPLFWWSKYRWQDEAFVVQWLYERTEDPKLLDLANLLQKQGYDWEAQFVDFKYTEATDRAVKKEATRDHSLQTHGVNNSQALKVPAVQYRITGSPAERTAFFRQLGDLDRYHGMPNGMFSCDEHLGGLEPQHGSELCSVVETMYSLEIALATFGNAPIGDRLEKIAYNCLPGTFSDDMWAHQYNQESNQIQVGMLVKPWTTDGPESNIYGLQPNFGCCTANFHQGWPKYTSSLWMKSPDDGLVAALFAPSEVRTTVRGSQVHIIEETDYPFRNTVRLTVNAAKAHAFPLSFRVPVWATGATAIVNGKPASIALTPGTFARIHRTWNPGDTVELAFPMTPRLTRWYNRSVAIERGPLVFCLDPGEQWSKLHEHPEQSADWQVDRKSAWNYALNVNEATVGKLAVTETPIGRRPFASTDAGVRLQVPAKRLDAWQPEDNIAPAPPASPVASANPMESLTFVPYGAAKLRVTAFPSLLS